jgi:hypothetical protein
MYAQGVYKIFTVIGGPWPLLAPLVPPLIATYYRIIAIGTYCYHDLIRVELIELSNLKSI